MKEFLFLVVGLIVGAVGGYFAWHSPENAPLGADVSTAPRTCTLQIQTIKKEVVRLKREVEACNVRNERERSGSNNEEHSGGGGGGTTAHPGVDPARLQVRLAAETILLNLRDAESAAKQLEDGAIDDFQFELAMAKPASKEAASILAGEFRGDLIFFKDNRRWSLEITFNQDETVRDVQGSALIVMKDEQGNITSRGKSEGKLGLKFRKASGNSSAIIVSDGSPSGYFQFFPNRDPNILLGNYYDLTNSGEIQRIAIVQANRVR